ncbi:MAG: hypothetical protein DDG59_06135 [Anaerolineae bacterium]|jgi:hypothetical protein|nr:MAG: hypothetical protein DDG59_06135 [Anaerolineae bacterium]
MDVGILDLLRRIATAEAEVRLLNVYQGIPIAFPAAIVFVGQNSITVKTERYQLVCLYQEKQTYIQYPGFPSVIRARVERIEPLALQASLFEFEYMREGIGERRQIRVWPKEGVTGELQLPDRTETIKGELADISLDGMGIYLPENEYYMHLFRQGRKVAISLRLPGVYQIKQPKRYESSSGAEINRYDRTQLRLSSIHTPSYGSERDDAMAIKTVHSPEIEVIGIISNHYTEANTHRYRIGIRLQPNEQYRSIVSQFISQRQSEIIQEINAIYRLLTRESGALR